MLGSAKMSKRLTSCVCQWESEPFLELNEVLNASEVVDEAVETYWDDVLVVFYETEVTLHASQVEEFFFCTVGESVDVLQGCLEFFSEEI